ncbi:MAG: L,D-transpeptidase family protein [Nitrospirae bacterium]|nr:L,D-transpeptidase family protein [Nitrospirota bacterium]
MKLCEIKCSMLNKLLYITASVVSLLFCGNLYANDGGNAKQQSHIDSLSGNVFTDNNNNFNVILVDKHTSTLYSVIVKDTVPYIVQDYKVITGGNNGSKVKEGDLKTPEGFYFVTKYIPPDKLDHKLFGDGALTLNYPNIVDKNMGRTGHGIWIHGMGEERNDNKTKGCVALQNKDFEQLKTFLILGTPVIISEHLHFLNKDEYMKKKKKYMDIFKKFITSWEKGDYEGFASFFDTKFKGEANGNTAQQYLAEKKKLMKIYPHRKVVTSDLNIFTENSSAIMYKFNQLYCADNVLSYGTKLLYLTGGGARGDEYKVVAEEFNKMDVDPIIAQHVTHLVSKWRAAWAAKDIEKYMSHYSAAFSSDGMNAKQWKAHKKGLFKASRSLKVHIKDIKFKVLSGKRIEVTFIQEYTSDTVSDKGLKTLVLHGCPGDYKIIEESWRHI